MSLFGNKKPVDVVPQVSLVEENERLQNEVDRLTLEAQQTTLEHVFKIKTLTLEHEHKCLELRTSVTDLMNRKEWEIESARNEVRKNLKKAAFESDLARVAAEASLKAYEKTDRKDERAAFQKHFETLLDTVQKAVTTVAPQPVINVNNTGT